MWNIVKSNIFKSLVVVTVLGVGFSPQLSAAVVSEAIQFFGDPLPQLGANRASEALSAPIFNDNHEIAYWAPFTNGTNGIFVASFMGDVSEVPLPAASLLLLTGLAAYRLKKKNGTSV